jgi:hypothetical protein
MQILWRIQNRYSVVRNNGEFYCTVLFVVQGYVVQVQFSIYALEMRRQQ